MSYFEQEAPNSLLCLFISPESTEVTCQQPRARSGLPWQLWLSAQRGPSSGCSPSQRQPDAHLQECRNHQRLNQPQPSSSPMLLLLFTCLLYYSCLLLRVIYTQHHWTLKSPRDVPLHNSYIPFLANIRIRHTLCRNKDHFWPDGDVVVNIMKRERILFFQLNVQMSFILWVRMSKNYLQKNLNSVLFSFDALYETGLTTLLFTFSNVSNMTVKFFVVAHVSKWIIILEEIFLIFCSGVLWGT